MQRHEEESRRRLGLGKLARKVLRLLRADAEFPFSSIGQEKFAPVNISHYSQRENRSASLNAERKKAEALMAWQRHRIIR